MADSRSGAGAAYPEPGASCSARGKEALRIDGAKSQGHDPNGAGCWGREKGNGSISTDRDGAGRKHVKLVNVQGLTTLLKNNNHKSKTSMTLNVQLESQGTMTIQKWREASNVCPPFVIFIFSGKMNGFGGKGICFFFFFLKQISSYSMKKTLENLILQPLLSRGNSHHWMTLKSSAEKLVNDFMLESSGWHLCDSNNQSGCFLRWDNWNSEPCDVSWETWHHKYSANISFQKLMLNLF